MTSNCISSAFLGVQKLSHMNGNEELKNGMSEFHSLLLDQNGSVEFESTRPAFKMIMHTGSRMVQGLRALS